MTAADTSPQPALDLETLRSDLIAIAEVVRDLYRSESQPEQSYSERQLYEQALDRMAREVAAVRKVAQDAAVKEMEGSLGKKKVAA